MGLSDRFGGKSDDDKSKSEEKDDKLKDKDDKKDSSDKDDKDSKSDSLLGKLTKNPYASNAKDVLTGKKSKLEAGKDAAKYAMKKHGGKLASKAALPAAHYGAMGIGYLWIVSKGLQFMNMLLNLLFNNPISNIIANVIAMASHLVQAVSHAVGAAVHAVGGLLHGIGSAIGGAVHAVTGSSSAATTASIAAQVAAVMSPIAVIAVVGTAIINPKNADELKCEIENIANPTYSKLGKVEAGSDANKTARNIYNALRKAGYTKNVSLALVANLFRESTFNPKAVNGSAKGIVQWMGGRCDALLKYADSHHGSADDLSIQLGYMDYELHNDKKNVLDAATKAGSLDDTTDIITNDYEVPGNQEDEPRREQAHTYEKMFESSSDDSASNNDSLAQSAADDSCNNDDSENIADWTGSIKESIPDDGMHWSRDDVPSDIKKYVVDPTKVGMTYNQGGQGWDLPDAVKNSNAHSEDALIWQCVTFADSYFLHIHKNMKSPRDWIQGNGGVIAKTAASKFGGKVSNTPHAGDIASVTSGAVCNNMLATGDAGHVFVVSHVLKNGTVIGLEENMTWDHKNLSGTYNWTVGWDYVVLTKKTYQNWKLEFYQPDKSKYPVHFTNGN